MDSDSWRVARLVARVSLVRRQHRLDDDMRNLKEWRCKHSRKCWWCTYANVAISINGGHRNMGLHASIVSGHPTLYILHIGAVEFSFPALSI